MTMILPEEKTLEAARQELIDQPLEYYISTLARTKSFSLEIAAEAEQLFDALAANWPQLEGWETQAIELQCQIKELAEPFMITGGECHLRLSLNVAVAPRTVPAEKNAPAVRAAFDVTESAFYHQATDVNQISDMVFDHINVGLVLLIQPFHGQGDARAIGIG